LLEVDGATEEYREEIKHLKIMRLTFWGKSSGATLWLVRFHP
jgi:hypothetical protein